MVEMLVIVDKNNKIIGSAPNKEVKDKVITHRGSDILVFNSKGEILITKRAATKRLLPSLFQLGFGGGMREGESYEECAERELFEESGIRGAKLELLFSYYYEDEVTSVFPNCYKCVYDEEIIPQKEEVDDYMWVSLPKLTKMIKENPETFTKQDIFVFKKYLEHQKSI